MKHTSVEETIQTAKLLEQKAEIDAKIKYFKGVLKATGSLINAIDNRIKRYSDSISDSTPEKCSMFDEYDIAKLELEKLEVESKLYFQTNYYQDWLQRKKEYDVKYAEVLKDCELNYDSILKGCMEIRKTNPILNDTMNRYEASEKKDDIKIKSEYYLYLKQNVQNHVKFSKKK